MVTKQICEFREVILKNIFNEYNHYHDKFGRFTSNKSGRLVEETFSKNVVTRKRPK